MLEFAFEIVHLMHVVKSHVTGHCLISYQKSVFYFLFLMAPDNDELLNTVEIYPPGTNL